MPNISHNHLGPVDRVYPLQTQAPTSSAGPQVQAETNMVVVGILVCLIIVLTVILILLLIRPVMDYLKTRIPENPRRKEMRYKTVEGWVISKRLRRHDDMCERAMARFTMDVEKGDKSIKNASSYDTAETEPSFELEWKECPICMEEFSAGEIVSWSPDDQTSCQHFFHHECIKEWLLRSPHCPYCRGTIIPVDENPTEEQVDKTTLLELSKRRAHKANTTYCCVEHGLVRICRPTKVTRRDKEILEKILESGVDGEELVHKRGGRLETTEVEEEGDDFCTENVQSPSAIDSELSSMMQNGRQTTALHAEDALPHSFVIPLAGPAQPLVVGRRHSMLDEANIARHHSSAE